MLVRADPETKSVSMLSFPRDLFVEIHCPGRPTFGGRINGAYSECGTKGTLETVRKLTGLPINYLITVNFRGFRQLVDAIGGVWMDVDRRYFNDRGGDFGYATINLFPGYQKLGGYQALDFVRYRHTDNDLYRIARQQLFVRAFKDQIKASAGPLDLPKVVRTITENVEVGQGGNKEIDVRTVLRYALFAYSLPPGHFFQAKIEGLEETSGFDILAPEENIRKAVQEFAHPDVESPEKATAVALNEKPKPSANKAPPPRETTITVLNGNGVTGSAGTASYLLSQRSYQMVYPPDGKNANAPNWEYFQTRIHFDKAQAGAEAAAQKVATLFGTDDVAPLDTAIQPLANGAMLTVIVGQTFHGTLAEAPVDKTPQKQPANVAPGAEASLALLQERGPRLPFPVMVPTVIDRNSWIDRERPVRMYRIDPEGKHKTIRLTYRNGASEYWGVQMTDWEDAPVLAERNFVRSIGGRRYELHYTGPKLHMVVLRQGGATYWIVNTLLDSLSNETMLAIAKGLKPLPNA
jgi:LCP family protein required for cell wall assembly